MKKEYIVPSQDVVEIETRSHLLVGSGERSLEMSSDEADDQYEVL